MRRIGISLILLFGLAACNMTTANQPEGQSDTKTVVLSSGSSTGAQASAATQTPPLTATLIPTTTAPIQNMVVQNASGQNAAGQNGPAAVLPSCTPRTDWAVYTVVAGDTLSQIGARMGASASELVTANCLSDANAISVGQSLRVPFVVPAVSNTTSPSNLPIVGDFAGMPDLQSCWASNAGTSPIVYDAIDGKAVGVLSNRLPIIAATPTWVKVYLNGTKTTPESSGWMRVADVSLIGPCTELTGVQLNSFRGIQFGNPAGVPDNICAVVVNDPNKTVPLYGDPTSRQFGVMIGWGRWVSTQDSFFQVQFQGSENGNGSPLPVYGWVDANLVHLTNCTATYNVYLGNPAGVPDNLCAVVVNNPVGSAALYKTAGGIQYGYLSGFATWVSTQGNFYQVQGQGLSSGQGAVISGWVDTGLTHLVNCFTSADTQYGNPSGVPNGICAVVVNDPNGKIPVYSAPGVDGTLGYMIGWAQWVKTDGLLYQVQFQGNGGTTVLGWVGASMTSLVNC